MSTNEKITTLWITVMINMAFADILGFMTPAFLEGVAVTGQAGGIQITPMFLLIAAVFIEIPLVMIWLTRAAAPRVSRRLNLIAPPITALFIVGGGSLAPHYIFIASCELIALAAILVLSATGGEGHALLGARGQGQRVVRPARGERSDAGGQ